MRKNHSRGSGRRSIRSPEAMAYWDQLYVDRDGQTIAACHRETLAEERKQGWGWPECYGTTRQWSAHRCRGRGRKKGTPPKVDRKPFEPASKRVRRISK